MVLSKEALQIFDVYSYILRKLNELEVRKEYQTKISNTSTVLENSSYSEDLNRAWENITKDIEDSTKKNVSLDELKQRIPWFDEECSRILAQSKQAKMQ